MAINSINDHDIWRLIPPEEKLELMSRAQSKGLLAACAAVIVAATCAVGLRLPWLLWGVLIASPIVYQFTLSQAWRTLKPAMVLAYLAARSVARRYAFGAKANDLSCSLLFRGRLERVFNDDEPTQALEAAINNNRESEVWIALFKDTIVIMSEQPGGAKLEFAHPLNDKLLIEAHSESGGDYASDKEIILAYQEQSSDSLRQPSLKDYQRLRLTSRHPAALVAFEKKALEYRQSITTKAVSVVKAVPKSEDKLWGFQDQDY
jgi:hypothetical protein